MGISSNRKARLDRGDWLEAAMQQLEAVGIHCCQRLKIEITDELKQL
jgi:hypothetical protein